MSDSEPPPVEYDQEKASYHDDGIVRGEKAVCLAFISPALITHSTSRALT
jgi:hypothetical protein